ncbi:MAG: aspartate/glutamate racemase family protein [Hyphomicrobiaceae bacterium]
MTRTKGKAGTPVRKLISYQLVAPMEATLGTEEIERRRAFLQRHAGAGIEIEVRSVARGTASIESAYDAAVVVPYILESLRAAVDDGADAVIIGCFSDPGIDALREIVEVPAVGPGMSAMLLALQLGNKFSIIAPNEKGSGHSASYVRQLGIQDRYASTRGMGLSVVDLARSGNEAMDRIVTVGQRCIDEDGAHVLVLGCMSMAFLGIDAAIQDRLGVPVVSPVIAALKTTETMLAHGISHSRLGWSTPPQKPILERPKLKIHVS